MMSTILSILKIAIVSNQSKAKLTITFRFLGYLSTSNSSQLHGNCSQGFSIIKVILSFTYDLKKDMTVIIKIGIDAFQK